MNDDHLPVRRRQLLAFYHSALKRVNGRRVIADYLAANPLQGDWAVIAIGKAAPAMVEGAQQSLGERLQRGLLITRHGHAESLPEGGRWKSIESGHPLPDEASLRAGEALLQFVDKLPDDLPLLFLLSGGASALVEVPSTGVTLDDLIRTNEWLLASGLAIAQMNAVRRRLSRIKGGRLARHLKGHHCLQLLISDVPRDDPAVIGSAPLYPTSELPLPHDLPAWLQALLQQAEPAPEVDDPIFARIETHIVADNALALQTVREAAEAEGLTVYLQPGHFHGLAQELPHRFIDAMLAGPAGLYLWGGESTVKLPRLHGHGGRSQHLALSAAELLAGRDDILLLAAGTDGSDGGGDAAGALVDGGSKQRGEEEGFSLRMALANADSGTFLAASGDLIETGPTGSNVMDLVIGWKADPGD